mgnify:CR=1 FL=1
MRSQFKLALIAGACLVATAASAQLANIANLNAPNFMPATGSPALTGAAFGASLPSSFFTTTTYRGAFGTTNWMAGWTKFDYTKTATGY